MYIKEYNYKLHTFRYKNYEICIKLLSNLSLNILAMGYFKEISVE